MKSFFILGMDLRALNKVNEGKRGTYDIYRSINLFGCEYDLKPQRKTFRGDHRSPSGIWVLLQGLVC